MEQSIFLTAIRQKLELEGLWTNGHGRLFVNSLINCFVESARSAVRRWIWEVGAEKLPLKARAM